MSLILASGSAYRRNQLKLLGFDFDCISPDIDETPQKSEIPKFLCIRLAREKAQKVLLAHPQATVIGADQVCVLHDETLGKPGTIEKAIAQLNRLSGQQVLFHSAVAVANSQDTVHALVTTEVVFRTLSQQEIRRYVELDNPIDCAGALKSEKAGSLLLERVTSDDPSALIGLPLIQTTRMLREFGINPLI